VGPHEPGAESSVIAPKESQGRKKVERAERLHATRPRGALSEARAHDIAPRFAEIGQHPGGRSRSPDRPPERSRRRELAGMIRAVGWCARSDANRLGAGRASCRVLCTFTEPSKPDPPPPGHGVGPCSPRKWTQTRSSKSSGRSRKEGAGAGPVRGYAGKISSARRPHLAGRRPWAIFPLICSRHGYITAPVGLQGEQRMRPRTLQGPPLEISHASP